MSASWTEFGLRGMPPMSARTPITVSPLLQGMLGAVRAKLDQPLRGISTDGVVRTGLFPLAATGVPTSPIVDAALAFLADLDESQRTRAQFPLDAIEWRTWFNIHPNVMRHGVMLEDLNARQRACALALMQASLSVRGNRQARDIMALNGLLVEITQSPDQFGEWPYFVSVFGQPSLDGPWGWQIDGHHLSLNVFVLGDQLVFTPSFMGSEPCRVDTGPLAGTVVLAPEQELGVAFMRSLDTRQAGLATRSTSILRADIPVELQHPIDGRMVSGAFNDNATIPYEGLRGDSLGDAQRRLLRNLIGVYVGWCHDEHAELKMAEVDAHLDETHFSWMGAVGDEGPFYYRIHSPVVLVEFDHHPGVVFDNLEPSMHHIHTMMRTPNGGDYGADLLRQHYERFDHSLGRHEPRD